MLSEKTKDQDALNLKLLEIERQSCGITCYEKAALKLARQGLEPYASEKLVRDVEDLYAAEKYTEAFNASLKVMAKDKLANNFLARARLVQAKILEKELVSQSVKAKLERISITLSIKTEKLDKAQRAYQSVLKYGIPQYSLQAAQGLSRCYLHYVQSLRGMPLPEDMSQADKTALQQEVDKMTIPIEEKGVESLAQAIELAHKARLRDGQAAELQKNLDKLNLRPSTEFSTKLENAPIYVPQVVAGRTGGEK